MVHCNNGIAPIQNKSIYGSQSIYGLIIWILLRLNRLFGQPANIGSLGSELDSINSLATQPIGWRV